MVARGQKKKYPTWNVLDKRICVRIYQEVSAEFLNKLKNLSENCTTVYQVNFTNARRSESSDDTCKQFLNFLNTLCIQQLYRCTIYPQTTPIFKIHLIGHTIFLEIFYHEILYTGYWRMHHLLLILFWAAHLMPLKTIKNS